MEFQHFDILEAKISQVLEIVSTLKREKEQLVSKIQELQSQLAEKDGEISALKEGLQREKNKQSDTEYYQEREAQIRGKVEGMLAKLDALELPL